MRKTIKSLVAGTFAFMALISCSEKEETDDKNTTYDDSYWASIATVTSSDANFTANGNGGAVTFKAEGGSVTLNVDCGCEWLVENSATDLFATSVTSTSLTVTADRNTVENDIEGSLLLKTAVKGITFATIIITQSAYGAPEITVETNEWNIPAKGALTTEIGIEATADWTAESADSWLTVTKTGTGISLTAAENEDPEERTSKITLVCTDGFRTASEYITVNQDARANVTFSPKVASFGTGEETVNVTVQSNYEWTYSYDTSNGWFSVSRKDDVLTVTVEANDGDHRNGTVTVTAGDGAENVVETQLTVSQTGVSDMILTYNITSTNTTVHLPLYGAVNCTVNWGDGSDVQTVTSNNPSHIYTGRGEYDVTISGTANQLYSGDFVSSSSPNTTLSAVKQWGKMGLTSLRYAFYYYQKLASLPEQTNEALANVSSFYAAFYYCSALKEIPADLFGGCSKATDFGHAFGYSTSLKAVPDGLFDDCTAATAFNNTFAYCSSLVEIPLKLFENCTKVTTFKQIFYGCTVLKTPTMFDKCPKTETLSGAFYYCSALEEIPEGMLDNCTAVTDLSDLFYFCSSVKTIPKGLFDDCKSATDFYCVFYDCSGITEIPEGLFDNCPEVTNFSFAFYECSSIQSIPAGLFDNCPKVLRFQTTFYNCSKLTTIPDGLFDKFTQVNTFEFTFYGCSSLTAIPDGLFDNCPEVTDFHSTFYLCSKLTKIPDGLFDSCTKVTTFYQCFRSCSGITEIPEGLFDNCPYVTDFRGTFYGCTKLTKIPTGLFSKNLEVTDFRSVFYNDSAISGESPYDEIDGVKVHLYERADHTDIYKAPSSYSNCFYGCTGLSDYSDIPSGWK